SLNLPIQLLPLPTYASWLNPIERLWKFLKKEVIHNHRWSACADLLKSRLGSLLTGLEGGSDELLSYCGLFNPKGIYAHALKRNSAVN
ncbi:transposase, partial [Spirosoma spitsbergense]